MKILHKKGINMVAYNSNISWRTDLNYNYGGNNWKLSNGLGIIYTFNK